MATRSLFCRMDLSTTPCWLASLTLQPVNKSNVAPAPRRRRTASPLDALPHRGYRWCRRRGP
eukprot:6287078-Pyramimonas_sp.AAC.1